MKSEEWACAVRQDPELVESLEGFIRGMMSGQGLDISMYDESFLYASIRKRVVETGRRDVADYGAYLMENRAEADGFYRALCVGHSEFFRNPLTFAMLEQRILPTLMAEKKQAGHGEIRIWSAGCAAGQEAWSVAMLLEELGGAGEPPVPYRIFATDRSASELAVARGGVYSAEAVGNVRSRHLHDYFSPQGESFEVAARLRERVDFSCYDLLDAGSSSPDASIYGDFDLILCCNLLFYYRPEIRQQILGKLCRVLLPGGYFVTGEVERDTVTPQNDLRPVAMSAPVFQLPKPTHASGYGHIPRPARNSA